MGGGLLKRFIPPPTPQDRKKKDCPYFFSLIISTQLA